MIKTPQIDSCTIISRSDKLLEAELGDEIVALDVDGGQCIGFNDVATFVWKLLESPRSFADVRTALLAEYDVSPEECTRELLALLRDLQERRLIE